MKRIQERYKDDKMKQQQEVMGLYKKYKINPAAGCLPVLMQMPIFFALYKVLFTTTMPPSLFEPVKRLGKGQVHRSRTTKRLFALRLDISVLVCGAAQPVSTFICWEACDESA